MGADSRSWAPPLPMELWVDTPGAYVCGEQLVAPELIGCGEQWAPLGVAGCGEQALLVAG